MFPKGEGYEMKISHFALFFVIIAVCILLPLGYRVDQLQAIEEQKNEYNNIIDDAVDDAVSLLVETDRGDEIVLNKELAVSNFFTSLYNGFGIYDDVVKQEYLKMFIPVIMIVDQDGYYIYQRSLNSTGDTYYEGWSEKRPFSYKDPVSGLMLSFTLEDNITILDPTINDILQGDYHDLASYYTSVELLNNDTLFETTRKQCIIDHLSNDMQISINKHNMIAEREGITYNFVLPAVTDANWYRTIDDVSFLAIFQGYPYGTGVDRYNRYALGAARLHKSDMYVIKEEAGVKYYHRYDCPSLTDTDRKNAYYTKKQCAILGAYPAEDCKP